MKVKQLKNRYNDPAINRSFIVGVDRAKMRLYDTENSAQNIVGGKELKQEDFPRTKQGRRNFRNAYKRYVIEMKEYKKTQQNLVKPSESNKNGLTALNTTDGLTSSNGTGSKTIILQRQIVQTNTPIPV